MSYNIEELKTLTKKGDITKIKSYMSEHNLKIEGNRIVPANKSDLEEQSKFWKQRQQVRKILLNS